MIIVTQNETKSQCIRACFIVGKSVCLVKRALMNIFALYSYLTHMILTLLLTKRGGFGKQSGGTPSFGGGGSTFGGGGQQSGGTPSFGGGWVVIMICLYVLYEVTCRDDVRLYLFLTHMIWLSFYQKGWLRQAVRWYPQLRWRWQCFWRRRATVRRHAQLWRRVSWWHEMFLCFVWSDVQRWRTAVDSKET